MSLRAFLMMMAFQIHISHVSRVYGGVERDLIGAHLFSHAIYRLVSGAKRPLCMVQQISFDVCLLFRVFGRQTQPAVIFAIDAKLAAHVYWEASLFFFTPLLTASESRERERPREPF